VLLAVCCSVLQCVAVYMCVHTREGESSLSRNNVLQCVAACCSVLQCVVSYLRAISALYMYTREGESSLSCNSVLQCIAVCCSVLQCVAVCRSIFTVNEYIIYVYM